MFFCTKNTITHFILAKYISTFNNSLKNFTFKSKCQHHIVFLKRHIIILFIKVAQHTNTCFNKSCIERSYLQLLYSRIFHFQLISHSPFFYTLTPTRKNSNATPLFQHALITIFFFILYHTKNVTKLYHSCFEFVAHTLGTIASIYSIVSTCSEFCFQIFPLYLLFPFGPIGLNLWKHFW